MPINFIKLRKIIYNLTKPAQESCLRFARQRDTHAFNFFKYLHVIILCKSHMAIKMKKIIFVCMLITRAEFVRFWKKSINYRMQQSTTGCNKWSMLTTVSKNLQDSTTLVTCSSIFHRRSRPCHIFSTNKNH